MASMDRKPELTRRELLHMGMSSAAFLGIRGVLPAVAAAENTPTASEKSLYTHTLQRWCDGLLAHQLTLPDPASHGALLCPACGLIHGRCGDAVYPLLRVAHSTGDAKYVHAALAVYNWSERNVSRADGSWVNDLTLSTWKGITVFRTIALAEALHHHGVLLDATARTQWRDRLARAAHFLDGFITLQTGNINYPITSTWAFALCALVLEEPRYLDRAHALAHEALGNFTANGLLFGEGHPFDVVTPKGCHPVDLGYNVEESLPALALYATLAAQMGKPDPPVLDQTVAALRTHLEFLLPDGGWDNSWGTRNYKWSYWGSRTSDGCQPAFVILSEHDPRFREAARRNLEQMAACTHNNLLYGGPDYATHGDQPCIHHTFTHAKALATVLDRGTFPAPSPTRPALPRDAAYGIKSFPEIATHLISIGDWRATVTEYDWEYVETVQTGGGATGGGHASGGALSMLYHQQLGPILAASMTQYALVEIANQQQFIDAPHMTLTPRIECMQDGRTYTSLTDLKAKLSFNDFHDEAVFVAEGRLLTASHQALSGEGVGYMLTYLIHARGVGITAMATGAGPYTLRLIVPVISRSAEDFSLINPRSSLILKPGGNLTITTDAAQGFEPIPHQRTFNLVPGFECVPFSVVLEPGKETKLTLGLFYNS